jgi:hypothetical protein
VRVIKTLLFDAVFSICHNSALSITEIIPSLLVCEKVIMEFSKKYLPEKTSVFSEGSEIAAYLKKLLSPIGNLEP